MKQEVRELRKAKLDYTIVLALVGVMLALASVAWLSVRPTAYAIGLGSISSEISVLGLFLLMTIGYFFSHRHGGSKERKEK